VELRRFAADGTPTGNEMTGGIVGFAAFLVGGLVAHSDPRARLGEIRGLHVGGHGTQVALFTATVSPLDFGNRGVPGPVAAGQTDAGWAV
jgi:hypothetical protein